MTVHQRTSRHTAVRTPAVRRRVVAADALRAELRRVPVGRVIARWLAAPLISALAGAGAGAVELVVAASASSPTPLKAPADIVLMGFTGSTRRASASNRC